MATKTTKNAKPKPPAKDDVRVFISYSHADEAVRLRLQKHLAPLTRDGVSTWYDGDMNGGDALDTNIARELRNAHLFIALLSPDYLASRYCWEIEYKRAMGRRARGEVRVVAIIVKPCDWGNTQAAGFKALPKDGRPVSNWRSADDALLDAVKDIRKVVRAIRAESANPALKAKPAPPKMPAARIAQSTITKSAKKPAPKAAPKRTVKPRARR